MNADKETIIDTKAVQDEAQQKRHPVLAVRNLLPSIIKEDSHNRWLISLKSTWSRIRSWGRSITWSRETIAAAASVVIVVAALVALYIYGASLAA